MIVSSLPLAAHMRNMAAMASPETQMAMLESASILEGFPYLTRERLQALNGAWAHGERISKFQPRTPPGVDPERQAMAA